MLDPSVSEYGSTVLLDLRFGRVQPRVARWENVCGKVCAYKVRERPIQKDSKATGSRSARARKGMTAKPKLGKDPKQIAQRKAVAHAPSLLTASLNTARQRISYDISFVVVQI